MQSYLIKNIQIVNEGQIRNADVLIKNGRIEQVAPQIGSLHTSCTELNGEEKFLFPGCIDDQVHFREPGLIHKATIATESKAAIAGGVTSYMEMPNTVPHALTAALLEEKYRIAAETSLANFSFYMGVSNSNATEVLKFNERKESVCGLKIFMGASTGNMLVDNPLTLDTIFRESEMLIATHCEDEHIIQQNLQRAQAGGNALTAASHPVIRNEEACFASSLYAVQTAKKYGTRLHILHISTEKELQLFSNMLPLKEKKITAEVCVHHLHFTSDDYARLGNLIKCNPAIKEPSHKDALWNALLDNRLDVVATDHAPHTWEEKNAPYSNAPSGLPLVQHSLLLMLHYHKQGKISLEKIVEKMCHAVADCFQVQERGYIREGYHADLVMVDLNKPCTVSKKNVLYKCGWSPLENFTFPASVAQTFVNGHLVYSNGSWNDVKPGQRLTFHRK